MLLNHATGALVMLFWLAGGAPALSRHATPADAPHIPGAPPLIPVAAHEGSGSNPGTTIQMRLKEPLRVALVRAGLGVNEANLAADALADDFDTVNPHPGLELRLKLMRSIAGGAELRLASLELTPRPNDHLALWREVDGALHLRRMESPVFVAPTLTRGVVHGSLYLSIVEAGVDPDLAAKVVRLFGQRLDLTRDIESGDRFRLVFEQRRHGDGQVVDAGQLLYADVTTRAGDAKLYRFQPEGAHDPLWVDGIAGRAPPALLRTPVDGAHLTSTFGMRLHPLLGFTRMHEGVDFGASLGAPVLAAGDGVVEEARWSGGYGRWLRIRHSPGLETGYGHLSAWGPGMVPGARVRQGQIVAFVGASGLATGPHLHYEIFAGGRRIDPQSAAARLQPTRTVAQDPNFQAHRADIDAAVSALAAACAVPHLFVSMPTGRCIG